MARRRRKRYTVHSDQPDDNNIDYKLTVNEHRLLALLMIVVAVVLISLIYIGGTVWVVTAVIISLVVLMLVVIGAPQLLPKILREIGRILGLSR